MELLTRTFDRYTGDDVRTQAGNTDRGDVIATHEDGWQWGRCEIKNPTYIILRVGVKESEARAMTTPELGDSHAKPLLRKREFHLDLDVLAGFGYPIPDESEMRKLRHPDGRDSDAYLLLPDNHIIEVATDHFQAARRKKDPLIDPMVIG